MHISPVMNTITILQRSRSRLCLKMMRHTRERSFIHADVITVALLVCPVASNAPIKSWNHFVFVGVAEEISPFTRYLLT